tara:strand:- start:7885 stop:8766 length:882 start_codon:yes stop_codon:yes gene_type:complete
MTSESSHIEYTDRDKKVQRLIIIEGCANVLMLVVKLFVGLSTNSLAILADCIHSLTDVANNLVAWVVIRLSVMPADREHPYGHRKFETLAVFGLATLLAVMAIEIAKSAFTKETTEIISGTWELALMIGILFVNIALATWQRYWARLLKSEIMLADATHTFADVLTTVVVIVGWQLSSMGFLILDRLCALGVSGLVLYLAYCLYKSAFPVLVDEYAIEPGDIKNAVMAVHGVKEVGRIRSRWIGSDIAIDIVISVNAKLTTEESHRIADKVELLIEKQFNVGDALIHIEPFSK